MKKGVNSDIPESDSTALSSDYDTNKSGKLDMKNNNMAMEYINQVIKTHRGIGIIHKKKNGLAWWVSSTGNGLSL